VDHPDPGDQVTGLNVIIGTQSPYPLAGNVPGSLSGGTFTATGAGQRRAVSAVEHPEQCGQWRGERDVVDGVQWDQLQPVRRHRVDDKATAVDPNIVGTRRQPLPHDRRRGGSSVNLSGPTSGPYAGTDGSPGIVFYQGPRDTGQLRIRRPDR